ncbi:hypothetical protein D3C81_1989420 [compost metagenome]
MVLSINQRRLIKLLEDGYSLRIVRSVINGTPVFAELTCPGTSLHIERVPWWRVERLLDSGYLGLNAEMPSSASELVPRIRRSSSE